ncbi:MAG: hypothetical protein ACOYI5_02925 [Christensenellales bacterium]
MNKWDNGFLGVAVDMAGCPNQCRHCWLGGHRNGDMTMDEFRDIARAFRDWRDENGVGIAEIGFATWWREPDYHDQYRALWALEQELSSPGRAQRFELLSTWRLARDPAYATWAATLAPRACQITLFGMEENTDWFMRRTGAFRDQMTATERLLEAGIAPRWQLFLTKRCLGELDDFMRLMDDMQLVKRCEAIGMKFEVFLNSMSPEGSAYAVDHLRVEAGDVARIPQELIACSREGAALLGEPEDALVERFLARDDAPNLDATFPCLFIDADYNVYPNIAEPVPWWLLGNIKTDGVDAVLRAYRAGATPGMRANREIPVRELARRYGDAGSKKLYAAGDLITRFLHEWGAAQA